MTENEEAVCLWAINTWGVDHQKRKAVEELSELITELAREQERTDRDRIMEELADSIIMCQQLRTIYGAAEVDGWIKKKIGRLFLRLRDLTIQGDGK